MNSIVMMIAAAAFAVATPLIAQTKADDGHASHHATGDKGQGSAALSEGEVRRIDKAQMKLTLRHGPLANLDMPAMTMVFQVKDTAVLDKLKVGDRIRFQADKVDDAYVVTIVEAAK
ncbi:MAG: copper-binding protein [Betaproteobacteria bacterium]|nr:copper-binding protein [Betaproteobacteria bacterium]